MYDRILVPLDGSEIAERVLPYVEALAAPFNSTVILLEATTPPEAIVAAATPGNEPMGASLADPTPIVEAEREEADEYLARVAGRLRERVPRVEYERPEGHPPDVIARRAGELGVDLIAMTTHGRGGLGRLVFGSVADEVLRTAPCPILLVRLRGESDE
jgi:nucleotide-binding universal stress UspA family protein